MKSPREVLSVPSHPLDIGVDRLARHDVAPWAPSVAWFDFDGQPLAGRAQHYRMTGDTDWLRRVAAAMIRQCQWILTRRAATPKDDMLRGLIKVRPYNDYSAPVYNYLGNAWCAQGVALAASVPFPTAPPASPSPHPPQRTSTSPSATPKAQSPYSHTLPHLPQKTEFLHFPSPCAILIVTRGYLLPHRDRVR